MQARFWLGNPLPPQLGAKEGPVYSQGLFMLCPTHFHSSKLPE